MSNQKYPNVVNLYITPGSKTSVHLNQPMHLLALMVRRGCNRLSFKLTADYCNRNMPEAYNNSLMDVYLSNGKINFYAKALENVAVFYALRDIAKEFIESGMAVEANIPLNQPAHDIREVYKALGCLD